MKLVDSSVNGNFDSATDRSRVGARDDVAKAFFIDGPCENGCCCGSVTGKIRSFLGDFDDELGAHVFESIFQFNFFGNGNAVFGDGWATERLVDDHVATGWSHGDRDCVSQFVDAAKHSLTSVVVEKQLLGHDWIPYG